MMHRRALLHGAATVLLVASLSAHAQPPGRRFRIGVLAIGTGHGGCLGATGHREGHGKCGGGRATPGPRARSLRLAELALAHRLPGMHYAEGYVHAGALTSHGTRLVERYRTAATYVDKILKGARPAELAVEESTRLYPAINLKTAAALGLTIPQSVLLRADEVIE
jgi:ABC transporter substrate binding protein